MPALAFPHSNPLENNGSPGPVVQAVPAEIVTSSIHQPVRDTDASEPMRKRNRTFWPLKSERSTRTCRKVAEKSPFQALRPVSGFAELLSVVAG